MMNAEVMFVRKVRIGTLRALAAVACVGIAALSAPGATAQGVAQRPKLRGDLTSLRDKAQSLADKVTSLEHRLDGLNDRRARLESEISSASAAIGVAELRLHDTGHAYNEAMDRYVARAVQAYKEGGSGADIALFLSAENLTQVFTLAEATIASAEEDALVLNELISARAKAEAEQATLDVRKQRLLSAQREVEAIAGQIESELTARRTLLRNLDDEIKRIEETALAVAATYRHPGIALLRLLQGSGPAQGIPRGFVGTGVTFEGVSSWYGPGFEGNPTASGDIFDPRLYTAASRDLPLGTWLYVEHYGRGVVVYVNDRGPYIEGRILDLSQAAAQAIGLSGIGWIEAEILIKVRD